MRINHVDKYFFVSILMLVSSCSDRPDYEPKANDSDVSISYKKYLKVYWSKIPRDASGAEQFVKYGDRGWKFLLQRTATARKDEFIADLSLIYRFDRKCTSGEVDSLQRHANTLMDQGAQSQAVGSMILGACGLANPLNNLK